jgi:acyl carrier protein
MTREALRAIVQSVYTAARNPGGPPLALTDDMKLADIPFRSLEISEAAMLIEDEIGHELNFDARPMREITTVGQLVDFFQQLAMDAHAHG